MFPRPACALTAHCHGNVTTIRLLGDEVRLDHMTAARLAPQLLGLARCGGARELVLDLRHVRFVTGAGVRLLLRLRKELRALGGRVRLRHVTPRVAEVFEVTKVGLLFGLRDGARLKDGWLFARGETLSGPVSTAELKWLVQRNQLSPSATVWHAHSLLPLPAGRAVTSPR